MPAHSSREYLRDWKRRHPERVRLHRLRLNRDHLRARWRVADAIRSGRLVRPSTCSECGVDPGVDELGRSRVEAHHDRYDDPLVVRWLCRPCHIDEHRSAA
jgi:hypothetical protein